MTLRFFEIAETNHRIQNPFTDEKLSLLGSLCSLQAGMRQLDLACGKGEMLCQWAKAYGITGHGVDISPVFIESAKQRAQELGVAQTVSFEVADASKYTAEAKAFDIVSCIGATWIGGGLVGTIKLMLPALKDGGLMLMGEPYWIDNPPQSAYQVVANGRETYATLEGTLDRIEEAGMELVEMVVADENSWDRYEAAQWMTLSDWLRAHPDDPDVARLRDWLERKRRAYLRYGRRYLGWGVFVLRVVKLGDSAG
jgi:SAM-dependent methyltransferase